MPSDKAFTELRNNGDAGVSSCGATEPWKEEQDSNIETADNKLSMGEGGSNSKEEQRKNISSPVTREGREEENEERAVQPLNMARPFSKMEIVVSKVVREEQPVNAFCAEVALGNCTLNVSKAAQP